MSNLIKKVKSMASFSNLKEETPIPLKEIEPPTAISSIHSSTTQLLNLIEEMEEEINLMPDQYRNLKKTPSFLLDFLSKVKHKNCDTRLRRLCSPKSSPSHKRTLSEEWKLLCSLTSFNNDQLFLLYITQERGGYRPSSEPSRTFDQ